MSLTGCSPIPLDEWRQAPRVSLRSVTHDAALHEHGTTGKSAQCGSLTLTVCWTFVHTGYVSLSELLLGVSPCLGMFTPEQVAARSFSQVA